MLRMLLFKGQSPYFKILELITFSKSLLPHKVTLTGCRIRTWVPLGAHHIRPTHLWVYCLWLLSCYNSRVSNFHKRTYGLKYLHVALYGKSLQFIVLKRKLLPWGKEVSDIRNHGSWERNDVKIQSHWS